MMAAACHPWQRHRLYFFLAAARVATALPTTLWCSVCCIKLLCSHARYQGAGKTATLHARCATSLAASGAREDSAAAGNGYVLCSRQLLS